MGKIVIVLLALFGWTCFAQETKAPVSEYEMPQEELPSTMHLTPTVGWSFMSFRSRYLDFDASNGVSAGGLVDVGSGYAGFQTGLLINQFSGKQQMWDGPAQLKLTYLGVPLLGKFNLMGSSERTIYVHGGLMPQLLLSSDYQGASGERNYRAPGGLDVPLVVGLGGAMAINHELSLTVGFDYLQTLVSSGSYENEKWRNQGFLLTGGLRFAL